MLIQSSRAHCNVIAALFHQLSIKTRDLTGTQLLCFENTFCVLRELIYIRDGYKKCSGFTNKDLDEFMLSLCTG